DGDTAKASIDLGPQITIHDDGPAISNIQDAIMPNVNNTDVHGTWQPVFGADGPSSTSAIGIAMGTAPAGVTYTVTDTSTHTQSGDEIYSVTVNGGATPYMFYEYVHYDASAQTAEMFAYANQTDAQNASGQNEFFTLSMNASGTYDFHLVSNSLQSTETFDFTKLKSGTGDWLKFVGSAPTFGNGNDPSSGYDLLIDGFTTSKTDPNAAQNTVHVNANGIGLGNGNLDTGSTLMFKFAAAQTGVSFGIGKANNATTEHFLVTLKDASGTVIATENITLPDGQALIVDAAHWGQPAGSVVTGNFAPFYEVDVANVANAAGDDPKINITGVSFNETAVVNSTTLTFTPTITDADGDKATSSTDLSVSLVGMHTGSGYQLSGTDDVFAASANGHDIFTATGTNNTVDFSNASGSVQVYLDGSHSNSGAASGDTLTGIENLIGSSHDGDVLVGDANANTLIAGSGQTTMTGGVGADTFVINAATWNSHGAIQDLITDYHSNESDSIDLSKVLDAAFGGGQTSSDALDSIKATSDGTETHISVTHNNTTYEVATLSGISSTINIVYDDAHHAASVPVTP
ncbi:type I secretion C-terminal target domain-containing protein, partial [Mesorhizobium sp. B2-6-2]|uniref:type I secretion C-terminal target domain-containing protein n=1 Tax=Mesorhizobium sp. B2-6-2 TaxID=2589915 RepID=UPI00112D563A